MATNSSTFNGPTETVADQVANAATQLKEKVSDLGKTAVNKLDGSRESAAGGLESAASALHTKAETVTGMAQSTADTLKSTAGYLRGNDVKAMATDVEALVRRNPVPALVAAAVIGFVIARAVSRNN